MTLRQKTIFFIVITLLLSLAVFYAVSREIITKSYLDLEGQHISRDIKRATNALEEDLAVLNRLVIDWAAWDDTYEFVENLNQDYIESNLVDTTFSDLKVNYIIYVNLSGAIVLHKAFDLEAEKVSTVSPALLDQIQPGSKLLSANNEEDAPRGFLIVPEGSLMFVAQPILTSNSIGPKRGTLIFAKYLNQETIRDLGRRTALSLSLYQLADPELPEDVQLVKTKLSQDNPTAIQPLSEDIIAGYNQLDDIFNQPVFILKTSKPRNLYHKGKQSFLYFILSMLIIGFIVTVVVLLLIENLVLSRVSILSANVDRIRESGQVNERIHVEGNDELSSLSHNINSMLTALDVASEGRYRDLFENANDAIFLVDPDYRYNDANMKATELFGYSKEEFLGMNIFDVIPPEQVTRSNEELSKLHEQKGYEKFEGKMRTKDGRWLNIEVNSSAIYNNEGEFIGSRDIVRDITNRKIAEEALWESEHRFRQVFEQNRDPVLLIDRNTDEIIDANRSAIELFHLSPPSEKKVCFQDFLDTEGDEIWNSMLREVDSGQKNVAIDRLNFQQNNDEDSLVLSAQIQVIKRQEIEFLYGIFTDISEKTQLDERWRLSLGKILQMEKMAFLGTMVSGFAHDINNPNQLIRGNMPLIGKTWNSASELLEELTKEKGDFILGGLPFSVIKEQLPQSIHDVENGSARIADIVKNLLDFAKGDQVAATDNVAINDVVNTVVLLMKHSIKQATDNFSIKTDKNIPIFLSNRLQLEQVIINLLSNALDALPHPKAAVSIHTGYDNATDVIFVEVIDQGKGIPADYLGKLKIPFFTTKSETGGTGLGLAITDAFVRAHGGRLDFKSTPGEGTTAILSIPLKGKEIIM